MAVELVPATTEEITELAEHEIERNGKLELSNISQEFFIWLAGFIDGEGCLQLEINNKTGRIHSRLYIVNTKASVIQYIKNTINHGTIMVRKPQKAIHKTSYAFAIMGTQKLSSLLQVLLPHFRVKAEQAKILIEWAEKRKLRPNQPYNAEEMVLYDRLKQLNKKGVPIESA